MIYCPGYTVSFQEVPSETSLVLLISDCPRRCPGCHSPELWDITGRDVREVLQEALAEYRDDITCICFMGTGRDDDGFTETVKMASDTGLPLCVYAGDTLGNLLDRNPEWLKQITYLKTGSWEAALGGLDRPGTNQRMYKCRPGRNWQIEEDITWRFQTKKEETADAGKGRAQT